MKARFTLTASCLLFFSGILKAQENELANSYNTYQQKNLHEKLFVHTDKSSYLTGEIMWFKIYYVNAVDNKPLNLSKVAYVDVLDKNQLPVLRAKIALEDGTGNGSLYLPVNLTNGNYKLRAYTNWMKNYGPAQFFEKQITIVNPLRSPEEAKVNTAPEAYDIQFFPEGGNLVAGAENRVGFRMAGKNGKGVTFNGMIVNQKNDTVAQFRPARFGMGSFKFSPVAGNTYEAVIKTPGKNTYLPLNITNQNSYGMLVTESGGNISIRVNTNSGGGTLYLVSYGTGLVNAAQRADVSGNSAKFVVDKTKLSSGINHFVVFNSARQPVAERLFYARPVKKLALNVTSLQQVTGKRKKVEVGFNSTETNQAVKAMLSMAVYKTDSLQKQDDVDIQNYLLLTSELKGNVESPGYYFANTNAETDAALDNLMLVQGWRQFDRSAAMANKQPELKFLPEYNGHTITGKIYNSNNVPESGAVTYLAVPSKRVQMYTALSDSTGKLLFNTKQLYGPSELVVQTNPDQDTTSRIEILTPFSEQYNNTTYPSLNLGNAARLQLKDYSLGMQVQNIYLAQQIRQFYDPAVDSSTFFFKPYKTYKLDDFTRFTTMEEVLREYVVEVNLSRSHNRFHLKTLAENGLLEVDPLIMVDGVPVFNANNLLSLDPLKIQKLDVVNSRYFYGPSANDGIFSFTSYKGNLGGLEINPHAVILDYEGMQLQRKFYSPLYDSPDMVNSRIPDFRNVLYWLPVADTDDSGKNTATFYTGDRAGTYTCVIQGITANGEVGYTAATFEVK